MTRSEKLRNEMEDALFAYWMDGVARSEGQTLEAAIAQTPPEAASAELRSRCRRTICRGFARQRRRKALRTVGKAVNTLAIIVFTASMLFAAAYAALPEVRDGMQKLFTEPKEKSTTYSIDQPKQTPPPEESPELTPGGTVFGHRIPALPEGYSLVDQRFQDTSARVRYTDNEGGLLSITYWCIDRLNVDTENAEVEEITVNGYDARYIRKAEPARDSIVWGEPDHGLFVHMVGTNIDEATMLAFAEEITYVGE